MTEPGRIVKPAVTNPALFINPLLELFEFDMIVSIY
jgi:hypothetical protein